LDNCNIYEQNKLESIQLEAGRIVSGITRSITLQSLYRETGWLTLADRRIYQKLVIMFIKLSILLYQPTYVLYFQDKTHFNNNTTSETEMIL